ncbi:unnamed protein product [Heligmosomoides polygyrus]|uniref:RRM domain-containing protein n=1 Tax=Heligmosomoides polygyrus TaxID=6339 RepID=A0A3P8ELV7_HELPZ|nr:unnamed protein product [Heligmosomoides polygyrus]
MRHPRVLCTQYGKVVRAKIYTSKKQSTSACYGYVTMADSASAEKAAAGMHKTQIKSRTISVEKVEMLITRLSVEQLAMVKTYQRGPRRVANSRSRSLMDPLRLISQPSLPQRIGRKCRTQPTATPPRNATARRVPAAGRRTPRRRRPTRLRAATPRQRPQRRRPLRQHRSATRLVASERGTTKKGGRRTALDATVVRDAFSHRSLE